MDGPASPAACRAAAQLGRTVNRALDEATLTPAAYRLLAYLSWGAVAAGDLANRLAISRPSITATTDWLVAHRYVTRTRDTDDGRRVTICMTDAGKSALAQADEFVGERLTQVLAHMPPEDAARVVDALELLMDALNAYRAARHRPTEQRPVPS